MKRQLVRVLALLVALTCAHEPHALARARAPQADTVADRVEALAQEASELVRSGEFHGGSGRYEEAYGIEPAAALLYNIAFVYDRKLDDPRSARAYYERYLLAPDAEPDGSARARHRLVDLKRVADRAPEPEMGPIASSTARTGSPESALRFALVEPPRENTWAWSLRSVGTPTAAM